MFINFDNDFGEQMKVFTCEFEIKVGDNIQHQTMEVPRIMLEQQFEQLMSSAAQDTKPIRVKMARKQPIYDNFDDKWIDRELSVTFANNKYIEVYGDINS